MRKHENETPLVDVEEAAPAPALTEEYDGDFPVATRKVWDPTLTEALKSAHESGKTIAVRVSGLTGDPVKAPDTLRKHAGHLGLSAKVAPHPTNPSEFVLVKVRERSTRASRTPKE